MKKISTGVENFKRIIDDNFYYIDKTNFINDVLNEQFSLYSRPRRFGKTLNMSMLNYFFSIKEKDNAYLFDGLNISQNKEAIKHQNQYPVIFITLKDMKRNAFDLQVEKFASIIANILETYRELLSSKYLSDKQKRLMQIYYDEEAEVSALMDALLNISKCLEKHYQKKVIILIDEYDVPLQSAYTNGYYDEMVNFLRNVFSSALKTNDALEKGILTGCLRISKESIFTGLNNFKVNSIMDVTSSDAFGFKQDEVNQLLLDYGLSDCKDEVKEWYDGYLFGKTDIYNSWSTLMYVDRKLSDKSLEAVSFWANTSGNDIVVNYIAEGDNQLHEEFEALIQGKSITKLIKPELTYRDMDNINNIYSFLLITGYLKIKRRVAGNIYELVIPNKEVYEIYNNSFMDYFKEYSDSRKNEFIDALHNGDARVATDVLNDILERSISYFDNYENFYHGFLVGLLQGLRVSSNKESGNGRFDVEIMPRRVDGTAIVIECKHSKLESELISDSIAGAKQIIDKKYLSNPKYKDCSKVLGYGISFNQKQCYITMA